MVKDHPQGAGPLVGCQLYYLITSEYGWLGGFGFSFAATWIGAILAVVGMYLLSVTEGMRIAPGDVWVLVGAVCWAGHAHVISRFSQRILPVKLAAWQFLVCSLLSFVAALLTETITWHGIQGAIWAILYGGLISVGIGYTLQVIAQRDTHPAHAAIIMSLESVFALIGGVLLLGETLALRGAIGCGLMLTGMLLSQLGKEKLAHKDTP